MKPTRLTILVTILIVLSLGLNLNSFLKPKVLWSSNVMKYNFVDLFLGGALIYRPTDSDSLAIFDLTESVVEIKFNKLRNCATIRVLSNDGYITSSCINGTSL